MESEHIVSKATAQRRLAPGQLETVIQFLHKVAGFGVAVFLVLHLVNILLIGAGQAAFEAFALDYHQPLARFLHIGLFFCILFYAINSARTVILDLRPRLWMYQKQSVFIAAAIFLILFIPSAILILMDTLLPY